MTDLIETEVLENSSYAYQKFKQLKEEKGMTSYQVSKLSGVSTAVLTQWSQGAYQLKLEKLKDIAEKAFGVPVTVFIE